MSELIHTPIRGPEPLSKEWFNRRSTIIGASEAAAACGMSEYSTPRRLYEEKIGNIEPFAGNEHTKRGRRYEPLIAEDWQEMTGRELVMYPCPMYLHPAYDWLAATPDGIITETELLEIKSTTWRSKAKFGEQGSDDIPTHFILQAQQQMAVMGAAVVIFAVKIELDQEPLTFTVQRNDSLIDMMISAEYELIQRIKNLDPPELNWEHSSTPQLVRELHSTIADTKIELSPEAVAWWEQYEALAQEIKAAKDQQEVLKAKVLAEIGDNGAGLLGNGKMIRRKLTNRAGYTVAASSYIDCRKVNAD